MFAKFLLCAILFLNNIFGVCVDRGLVDIVAGTDGIQVFVDGELVKVDEARKDEIIREFENMCEDSHEMPALGVSLHNETLEAMKTGVWVEFCFDTPQEYEGMPFESLLIAVEKNSYGFNIIRKHDGKYEGRCFYINLNNDMSELLNRLVI